MPVLELAPVSARFESPAAGDGALSVVVAGAVLLLSEADGVGVSDSAGVEAVSDGVGEASVGVGVGDSVSQALDGVVRFGEMFLLRPLVAVT
jgi:hypothetical protein